MLFLFQGWIISAQQDSQYTQYMYNMTTINPAYAGSRDATTFFGLYRAQWVGLEGAPITKAFSVHSPIGLHEGLGLSFVNDEIGPVTESTISADFSYTIQLSAQYQLAFGAKASANLLNVDYTKLQIYDPDDPSFRENIDNKFSPNVGAGAFVYSTRSYLGISVPYILETKHFDDENNSASVASERLHFYAVAGHVMDISPFIKFKPSILFKAVAGAPAQFDMSANFLFYEKFTFGIAYRWSAAYSVMAGFQISDGLFVGYAYDSEVTDIILYNSGSHEILLRFELFKEYDKVASPRFF